MVNSSEKENGIIELLKQSKSYSEIEQELHVSSRDISQTKKKNEEEQKKLEEEQKKVQISKASQALKLFEQGNTPVQVAVELDLELGEVDRIYKGYSESNGLYDFNQIYAEIKKNDGSITAFVKLSQITKKEGIGTRQIVALLKIAEEIPFLEAKYQRIKDNIDMDGPKVGALIKQKVSLGNDLKSMLDELQTFREYVESARENTNNELKLEQEKLDRQKASLASEVDKYKEYTINEINKCKECLVGVNDAKNQLQSLREHVDKLKQEEQRRRKQQEQSIQESQPQLKQQSVFIALAQAAQQALANDELRTQAT
jgi:hypothetical protein